MATSFLCGIHLKPIIGQAEAAKQLAECLGIFEAHGLKPFPFAETAWRDGGNGIFGGTTLIHGEYSKKTGDPFWGAGFMMVPAPEAGATIVTMTVPAQPLGGPDDAWHWLTPMAEEICDAINADIGMINGFTIDSKGRARGGTPGGVDVVAGKFPSVLCPWIYFGRKRLAETGVTGTLNKMLGKIDVCKPSPGGGWVLQVYGNYSGKTPKQFLDAYSINTDIHAIKWMGAP